MNRRDFVRLGSLGMLGLALTDLPELQTQGQKKEAKAKFVIQLWMAGGPCHIDTFDPKPLAGADYCGPYTKPIETNVPGIQLCQTLPLLAKQADKFSIIRSFTHGNRGHETAAYIVQTGRLPAGDLVYPSLGAVVALKKGADYKGSLPPYITITNPLGRFSEAGFLGINYKPYPTTNDPNADQPTAQAKAGQGKAAASGGMAEKRSQEEKRLRDRRSLLESLDTLPAEREKDPEYRHMATFQEKAYDLILGEAKKAFDLSQEKEDLRNRYGRNRFGQSCLLARRLVELGVPFVTVNHGGWDTHKKHFERMAVMLPELDRGFSVLLEDLSQRGLLDSTIVVWYGEFGRTPKIEKDPPWNGGRHHFGDVFSAVVAGGGFKGGKVVGASDSRGEKVKERPVYPWDLNASLYQLLGIDPMGRLPHPHGCVAYVTPIAAGEVQSAGLLTEIM